MARNGFPDDPDNHAEGDATQYANYGGTAGEAYSEYGPPAGGFDAPDYGPLPEYGRHQPPPWHHKPAALIGLGVLTAAVLALLVYAVVKFTNSGTSQSPAVTSTDTATSSAPPAGDSATPTGDSATPSDTSQDGAPSPSNSQAPPPPPTTVTSTVTPTTSTTPTTTEPPTPSTTTPPVTTPVTTSVATSVTISVTTVTETTTKPWWPTLPLLPTPAAGG